MTELTNGSFCWNELATPDITKAKTFYSAVFGWKFEEINAGDMTYTIIKNKEEQDCGGMWQIPTEHSEDIPPHWMTYILVNDIKAAQEKATSEGAEVVQDITSAGEMGQFTVIVDPTGAHIALWQSTNS